MSKLINECRDIVKTCKDIAVATDCEFKVMGADVLTTFKGGGKACVFYPDDERSFAEIYGAIICEIGKPYILGGGSNTVIADGLCSVPVISTLGLNNVRVEGNKVYAGCGAYLRDVTVELRRHGLGGFEFMSGVPATVGGAIRMNASAFSTQTADYIDEISILNVDCGENFKNRNTGKVFETSTLKRNELSFGYRNGVSDIILGAVFDVQSMDCEASKELAKRYLAARAKKQPKYPSCGSVFKNGSVASGKLIDECGLKGMRIGGAQISEMHGNFIVNIGGATANDFMSLVGLCRDRVFDKFGVRLENEFVYLE